MLVVTGDYTLSKRFLEFVVSLRFVSSENNFTSLFLQIQILVSGALMSINPFLVSADPVM